MPRMPMSRTTIEAIRARRFYRQKPAIIEIADGKRVEYMTFEDYANHKPSRVVELDDA